MSALGRQHQQLQLQLGREASGGQRSELPCWALAPCSRSQVLPQLAADTAKRAGCLCQHCHSMIALLDTPWSMHAALYQTRNPTRRGNALIETPLSALGRNFEYNHAAGLRLGRRPGRHSRHSRAHEASRRRPGSPSPGSWPGGGHHHGGRSSRRGWGSGYGGVCVRLPGQRHGHCCASLGPRSRGRKLLRVPPGPPHR